jgi:hypothetical protein
MLTLQEGPRTPAGEKPRTRAHVQLASNLRPMLIPVELTQAAWQVARSLACLLGAVSWLSAHCCMVVMALFKPWLMCAPGVVAGVEDQWREPATA